ncbi:MAG: hypothetical protein ACTSVI_02500 [Promethearchaeota archaeon]
MSNCFMINESTMVNEKDLDLRKETRGMKKWLKYLIYIFKILSSMMQNLFIKKNDKC